MMSNKSFFSFIIIKKLVRNLILKRNYLSFQQLKKNQEIIPGKQTN